MLSPDPNDAIEQLTDIFNSTNGITQWVGTLVNSVLPPMDPPPSWYSQINSTLQTSQQHAQSWLNDTAPDIIADMSTAFINYSDMFGNVVTDIKPTLAQIQQQNNIPNADQVQTLTEMFSVLAEEAQKNRSTVANLMAQMADYQTQMQSDFAALKTALAAALPEEEADRAAVQQVQNQIQAIEITLAADMATASAADIDTNSAMTSLVIGLTFTLEFDPVAFGIALIGLGVQIALDVETQEQVEADLKQIEALESQLTADQMQLALMQGIVSNLQNLSGGVETAMTTFDDFDDTWEFTAYGLNYLLVVLAQPQIDVGKIPDLNDLDDAVAAWKQQAEFAANVLNMTVVPQNGITISATSTN